MRTPTTLSTLIDFAISYVSHIHDPRLFYININTPSITQRNLWLPIHDQIMSYAITQRDTVHERAGFLGGYQSLDKSLYEMQAKIISFNRK